MQGGRPASLSSVKSAIFLVFVLPSFVLADYHMKLFARGGGIDIAEHMAPVCGDLDQDSVVEITYPEQYTPWRFQIWRYFPPSQFRLVRCDTYPSNPLPGQIYNGTFQPVVASDVNCDGRTEIVGWNFFGVPGGQPHSVVEVMGSRHTGGLPDTNLWWREYYYQIEQTPIVVADLDRDGLREIIYNNCYGTNICEYRGANRFDSIASFTGPGHGNGFPVGDYDGDGRLEFVTCDGDHINVIRCSADDSFDLVATDTIWPSNGHIDPFGGQNVDGTHVPKIFITPNTYLGPGGECYYLYMGEWVSGHEYRYTLIDTVVAASAWGRYSKCGDIDGDGLEEVIWSVGAKVLIYKWNGIRLERVWTWQRRLGSCSLVEIYDLNRDGYKDILISGGDSTYYFEVEGVRLHSPNGGQVYATGDTVPITWETFCPPRCDSVSLFLRKDTTWQLDTIAHGLPASETTYAWPAPNVRSDSCRIVAIAYGPGRQYDESDSCFRIGPAGMTGASAPLIHETRLLGVSPNPIRDHAEIRFQLAEPGRVFLRVSDVLGRTVAVLANDVLKPGAYTRVLPTNDLPSGIYFLDFNTSPTRTTAKLTVSH